MRNRLLLFFACASLFSPFLLTGQYNYVSTQAQNRTVVMEEFTGVNCGYCPQGHVIAQEIADNTPGTVLINIHAGSFATPRVGQPDFRTNHGTAINNGFGVTGYPSGMVNRYNGGAGLVAGRGSWSGYADQIKNLPSPVNVGMVSRFDSASRELTVDVEFFYTSDAPDANNYVSVVLLENGVIGYQANYDLPAGGVTNYEHNHILRDKLHTYTYGDTIYTTTAGTYEKRTYTYIVPQSFKIENCDVAAFVSASRENIYQGVHVTADGGSTLQIGAFDQGEDLYVRVPKDGFFNETMTLNSYLADGEEFILKLNTIEAPISWKTNLIVDGTASGTETTFEISGTRDFQLAIVPSGVHGAARYMLEMRSKNNPDAPGKFKSINILTDVRDLVLVTGEVVPNNVDLRTPYLSGLDHAQNPDIAVTDARTASAFIDADAFNGVNNLYFSVGWTVPSLTNATALSLGKFLDQGGNLLISGQDIGWDTWDANGNGTTITKEFWTKYLMCRYLNDGAATIKSFNADSDDPIFGGVGSADIVSVYGSGSSGPYVYPEEVLPLGGASAIFRYENNRVGGVRAQTDNFKVVYLGVGLEMLANDPDIANEIVKLSHDWFYGLISSTEFDKAMRAIELGQAFPNPASEYVTIPVAGEWNGDLQVEIRDLSGRLVLLRDIQPGTDAVQLYLGDLGSGTYFYQFTDGIHLGISQKLIVTK